VENTADVLLAVVKGATGVGSRDSNLDTRNEVTSKEASKALGTEEETSKNRSKEDESTRSNHLTEGSLGGDVNAGSVIGVHLLSTDKTARLGGSVELTLNLLDHVEGSDTDGLHGHSREPVRDHGTEEEASEGEGAEDINGSKLRSADEGTEESERHKSGRTDSETLANGSGSVTSSIEVISANSGLLRHVAHLSDTTGVVADRTISINSKTSGHGREDTEGSSGNTVHAGKRVRDIDSHTHSSNRDDTGLITKSKTVDNVGGGTSLTSLSKLTDGAVSEGSVVLSDVTDKKTSPETAQDAEEDVVVLNINNTRDSEGGGKENHGSEERDGSHDDGGNKELTLKSRLNLNISRNDEEVSSNERSQPRDNKTERKENNGEHKGLPVVEESRTADGRNNHGSTASLTEGAEQISTHTGNITDL
jgi:hypothetical protein